MAVRDIVHYGDPILRKKCSPVKDFSNLESLIDDLFDTMYEMPSDVIHEKAKIITVTQKFVENKSRPFLVFST